MRGLEREPKVADEEFRGGGLLVGRGENSPMEGFGESRATME